MATTTLVITYTPASGGASPSVTSLTVDGAAYAALTAAQTSKAIMACEGARALLFSDAREGDATKPEPGRPGGGFDPRDVTA